MAATQDELCRTRLMTEIDSAVKSELEGPSEDLSLHQAGAPDSSASAPAHVPQAGAADSHVHPPSPCT